MLVKGNFFSPTTEDVWGQSSPTQILFQKAVGFSRLGCFTFILQSNEAPPTHTHRQTPGGISFALD